MEIDVVFRTSPPEMNTPHSSWADAGEAIRPAPTSETATADPMMNRESFIPRTPPLRHTA
jgi:hypothetical protein